jgi:hypothetical protein
MADEHAITCMYIIRLLLYRLHEKENVISLNIAEMLLSFSAGNNSHYSFFEVTRKSRGYDSRQLFTSMD